MSRALADAPFEIAASRVVRHRRQSRRDEILTAARCLFAGGGYKQTTVGGLADAVGIDRGTLYHYFASKDELLFEAVSGFLDETLQDINCSLRTHVAPLDRVRVFAREHYIAMEAGFAILSILVRELRGLTRVNRASVEDERRRYEQAFAALIVEAQRTSVARCEIEPESTAAGLLWMTQTLIPVRRARSTARTELQADEYARLVAAAIGHTG